MRGLVIRCLIAAVDIANIYQYVFVYESNCTRGILTVRCGWNMFTAWVTWEFEEYDHYCCSRFESLECEKLQREVAVRSSVHSSEGCCVCTPQPPKFVTHETHHKAEMLHAGKGAL